MRTKTTRRRGLTTESIETLEPRVVLSRAAGFGAVGDSLSDEYRFYAPDRSHARNWVETLAATRPVDFGAYATKSRGEPRDQGYANDWARSDATSVDVVSGQLAGLSAQVAAGKVRYASVDMGTNDFLHFLQAEAAKVAAGSPPSQAEFASQLGATLATAEKDVDTTVLTLLAANPKAKVLLWTDPDVSTIPLIERAEAQIPALAPAVSAVSAAESALNAHIRSVAAAGSESGRVALVDIVAAGAAVTPPDANSAPFGGVTVRLDTVGDDYHDFILGDGIHPGTIGQGVIADAVIAAADSLGASITPLSPTEIVHRAQLVAARYQTIR